MVPPENPFTGLNQGRREAGGRKHMVTHLTGLLRALSMCMSHKDPASRPPPDIAYMAISSKVDHTWTFSQR